MPIPFLRYSYLILAELSIFAHTAPKLGHLLFDPLVYEAAKYVKITEPPGSKASKSMGVLRRFIGTQNKFFDIKTKKPFLGYDYDDKLCKSLGDRLLCGYNKNVGGLSDTETIADIGNGCFIRGDRVECGYVIGPFLSRRPRADIVNGINQHNKLEYNQTTLLNTEAAGTERINVQIISTDTSTISIGTTGTSNAILSTDLLSTSIRSKPTLTTILTTGTLSSNNLTTAFLERSPSSTTMKSTKYSTQTTYYQKHTPNFKCVDKNSTVFCYELSEMK